MFITKNRISTLYSTDYKNIAKIGFESIIKRRSLDEEIELDETLSYLAIISFNEKDLVKFLSDQLSDDKSLTASSQTVEYIYTVLDNSLSSILSSSSRYLIDYCTKIWSNALILLSYMKHNKSATNEILNRLVSSFDTNRWFDLSEAVNRFLVFQVNRYGSVFSVNDLKSLFDKQVEKINSSERIPFQARGRVFSNLLYLIRDNHSGNYDIFKNNRQLERFITKISSMELGERVQAINGFVFVIYSLAIGDLKTTIYDLFKQTFEESMNEEFGEISIIFGLDLYNIGVLDDQELSYVLSQLKVRVDKRMEEGSSISNYLVLKEQLGKIDKNKLQKYEDLVKDVAKLSAKMENIFNR